MRRVAGSYQLVVLTTSLTLAACLSVGLPVRAADHNDPNGVNSIFADVALNAGDLYGMFGFPSDDTSDGEKVVVALTFAPVPRTGIFDSDMLYRINLDPDPRETTSMADGTLEMILEYGASLKDKYFKFKPAQIVVTFDAENRVEVSFSGFPGGDFRTTAAANELLEIETPDGQTVRAYFGGRDDPFFNDLPGFFRSINYSPQFYDIEQSRFDEAETPIPKTLLELEGNSWFNFDPENSQHGQGVKLPDPGEPFTWDGDRFLQDEDGNYRFVYSGRDAQAGINVNALIFEIPLTAITESPATDRVVRTWGESFIRTAASRAAVDAEQPSFFGAIWAWLASLFGDEAFEEIDMEQYKLVDLVGVPFLDAALSERWDERQLANNVRLSRHFVQRLGHLGWGFGPSLSALGIGSCFDHDDAPVSKVKHYALATVAFPRAKKCLFQQLHMPDDSWRRNGVDIPEKRTFEIFIPNVTAIDLDTNGSWPFGRRLEDQVASRFLAVFLDMDNGCGGGPCNIETLGDQALWDSLPIVPKTPPNPLVNDKEFLSVFPYLAAPW